MNGTSMGFVPLDSNGKFVIEIKSFSLSAITSMTLKHDKNQEALVIRELNPQVKNQTGTCLFDCPLLVRIIGLKAGNKNLEVNPEGEGKLRVTTE